MVAALPTMSAGDTVLIDDPELAARLALSDTAFERYLGDWIANVPPREFDDAALARALGYPWERPERSYVLSDEAVTLVGALDHAQRSAVLERFRDGRTPLLAIGSNGAPETLRLKFAHFSDPADRAVLAIAGHLHGFDVGASAYLAAYGAMPATLFPSRGTAARCAILWLTARQFTQLVWTELSYFLGRLATRFEADEPEFDVGEVVAFVSRFGVFAPEGEPLALAAIPARDRTARALTQRDLLALAAELVLEPGAGAGELVRAVLEDYGPTVTRALRTVPTRGQRFNSPLWTPVVASAA